MPSTDQTAAALRALNLLNDAICEAVAVAGPVGCPAGVVFAPLSGGMTAGLFATVIDRLVRGGRLTRKGDLLFAVPKAAPIAEADVTSAIVQSLSVQRRLAVQKGGAL